MAAKKKAKKKVTKKAGKAAAKMEPRADLGASAESYFAEVEPALREVTDRLRRLVREAAPRAKESIKWGMPVYEQKGLLCYIQAARGYAKLGFYEQGIYLSDPDGLLEGTGESMRHVKVRSAKEIRAGLFSAWVKRAVEMNEDA